MKTRYWKSASAKSAVQAGWRFSEEAGMEYNGGSPNWMPSQYTPETASLDHLLVECTSDGTPLSELPADRLTLAEFDAFAARVRANLALLEKEGER